MASIPWKEKATGWKRPVCAALAAGCLLSVFLLLILPSARNGAKALCNALFAASEAANAYAYARFSVPPGQSVTLALVLAGFGLAAFAGLCAVWRNPVLLLCCAFAAAGGQAYFGLSLPVWGNIALFALLGLGLLRPALSVKAKAAFLVVAAGIAVCSLIFWPGVDEATEAASERARDRLSLWAQSAGGAEQQLPQDAIETRHINSQSLAAGERASRAGREYRLVTVEEQQISQPHWIDYLRIALLLLLSVALVALPFAPFLLLNARRKKALAARAAFGDADIGTALCAMFRHAAAYLEYGGYGGGNLPFRAWPEAWREGLPEDYLRQYRACAELFEEAAYSGHGFTEAQREAMRGFLAETERIFYDEADWKQRLRLRYEKCLHE